VILVDDRSGSAELAPLFPKGVSTSVTRMDFGDFCFLGNGPEGPAPIGIERKTIRDLLSSMTSGRLSGHQLIGLMDSYSWIYLIIEGVWKFSAESGLLVEYRGKSWSPVSLGSRRFMAKEVVGYLNTLAVKTGVIILYSGGKQETVQTICALYHWWDKEWESHSSHLGRNKSSKGIEVSLTKPNLVRRVAAELGGVGWGKSKDVAAHFGSVWEMVHATEREWRQIPGIGKILAQRVVASMGGEDD